MYCVRRCCRTHGRARRGRRPLLPRPSLSRGVRRPLLPRPSRRVRRTLLRRPSRLPVPRPPATAATPTPVRLARAASAGCYCRALARPRPARARRVPPPLLPWPSLSRAPRTSAADASPIPLARAASSGRCCRGRPSLARAVRRPWLQRLSRSRAPLLPKIALPPAASAAYGEDDAGASWDGGRRRQ